MKKNILIKFLPALCLSVLLIGCSDDDGDKASTSAGFAGIASSYSEADGDGTVFIPYRDGSISESRISVSGSATEGSDYTVSYADDGITVTVLDDAAAENIETVRFTIEGASGESNQIHTLSILSNDPGKLQIDLDWAGGSDLDLFLFYENPTTGALTQVAFSDPGGPITLDWTAADGTYYLSYNYYSGTDNAQAFTATFTPTGVTVNGVATPAVYNGVYTLANVDPNDIQFEQTFEKTGTVFVISDLDIPATGSRSSGRMFLPNPKGN